MAVLGPNDPRAITGKAREEARRTVGGSGVMTLNELLYELLNLKAQGHGSLPVITDMGVGILSAEFSDEDDDPAIVLATDA